MNTLIKAIQKKDKETKIKFAIHRNKAILLAAACLIAVLAMVIVMWVFVTRKPSVDTSRVQKESIRIAQKEVAAPVIKQAPKKVEQTPPQPAAQPTAETPKTFQAEKPQTPVKKDAAAVEEKQPVKAEPSPPTDEKTAKAETAKAEAVAPETAAVEKKQPPATTAGPKDAKPAKSAPGAPPPSRYSVQVGAFRSPQNANRYAAQLKEKGYGAYIFMKTGKKTRTWHTVRIGDYTNLKEASAARSLFKKKEAKPAIVTFFDSLKAAPAKLKTQP